MNTPLSYSVTRWKDGGWQHIDDAVRKQLPPVGVARRP